MSALEPVDKLASLLARLPGVGRRSAERMAMALVRDQAGLIRDLLSALQDVQARVGACSRCGNITLRTEDPCKLCSDPRRDDRLLCVVEDAADIMLMERAGGFKGRYYAIMGKISPMKGEGIPDARIQGLLQRIEQGKVEEIILAFDADTESDATASFIREAIGAKKVRITRLARGLPTGSGLAYIDAATLSRALEDRKEW